MNFQGKISHSKGVFDISMLGVIGDQGDISVSGGVTIEKNAEKCE